MWKHDERGRQGESKSPSRLSPRPSHKNSAILKYLYLTMYIFYPYLPPLNRVGIKKPTQKNHLKKPTKMVFLGLKNTRIWVEYMYSLLDGS